MRKLGQVGYSWTTCIYVAGASWEEPWRREGRCFEGGWSGQSGLDRVSIRNQGPCLLRGARVHHINWAVWGTVRRRIQDTGNKVLLQRCGRSWGQAEEAGPGILGEESGNRSMAETLGFIRVRERRITMEGLAESGLHGNLGDRRD